MFQKRSSLKTVTAALLIIALTLSHALLLPPLLNVSMQSENMRHVLKWSSLKETCRSVNYTVKYQGEFEYMQSRWQDEDSCREISDTQCDLTLALSSDSDYNITVLAWCNDSVLASPLPKPFNRRDTVLLAPDISVTQGVGQIEVFFRELQNHINVKLQIWKKGDEQNVTSSVITDEKFLFDVSSGGNYCLKAVATLVITNKSNSTDPHCVSVPEPEPAWLIPFAVSMAVILTFAMALTLGLLTLRCSRWLQKIEHHKEEMPDALLGWPSAPVASFDNLQEPTHSLLLVDPSEER
ncbi:interleukin-20 receptor subunit beta-like [Clarias magur]|uniref:Interleukin-20 receptor subunit beta-like n=1 Tax=Clarias magur TaxID=1594786 RepID=A0A8J4X618_CLAMG|nr:interleukin-20 receptor subunit beta-like [Clarias magur]